MKTIIINRIIILFVITLISCNPVVSPNQKIIEKFKSTYSEDYTKTMGEIFSLIAGLRGEVKYEVFKEKGEISEFVKIIQVTINRNDNSYMNKTAKIQYRYNINTDFFELAYTSINGKPQELLEGAMMIGMMQYEKELINAFSSGE